MIKEELEEELDEDAYKEANSMLLMQASPEKVSELTKEYFTQLYER